ncbi:MAG: hypothetical protein OEZ68_14630 [Gammaproteobacteria bacterium]|nr:hypothetical protein [Gammaproteobacteria bacterium]MDH5802039.1 hypothetical protein [Gammaproteobacteria bacterium]
MTLYLNSTNVNEITEALNRACGNVLAAYETSTGSFNMHDAELRPNQIAEALEQFVDIMQMIEVDYTSKILINHSPERFRINFDEGLEQSTLDKTELSEIGNYGLELMQNLGEWAEQLQLSEEKLHLHTIMVVVALWIARRGGYLTNLDTVVDTLASMANACYEPLILSELSDVMGELINAVAHEIRGGDNSYAHAWRVLNINRGIIAARTHDLAIMEPVFNELIANVPEDAPRFFEQNLTQMDELNYPAEVKSLLCQYFQHCVAPVLH